MLERLARLALRAPKQIIAAAALILVAVAVFGSPVAKSLSSGGFNYPGSESNRARGILLDKFGQGDMRLLVAVSSAQGVGDPAAESVARQIEATLHDSADVAGVTSAWTLPPTAAGPLLSKDRKTGLVVAALRADDDGVALVAKRVADRLPRGRDGVVVRLGGAAMFAEMNEQAQRDMVTMEVIAMPLSFLALIWVFGGAVAAALPVAVGMFSVLGALAALRVVTLFTDVSIFAMNLAASMGLALAIDYTLLILSRYRDEITAGAGVEDALVRTMTTAGRTVLFSALTVALSMSAMVLFPMYFLRSFAYAGVAVVAFALLASLVCTPAAIALLAGRLYALDVGKLARQLLGRPPVTPRGVQQSFWYRNTHFVMRHAVVVSVVVVTLLLLLGAPFLHARWGFPDDRVLPSTASSRQVGDLVRSEFGADPLAEVRIVVPDISGASAQQLEDYGAALSRVPDVTAVSSPTATYVAGKQAGPPVGPAGVASNSAFYTLRSSAALFTDASEAQLKSLHAVRTPAGRPVLFGGYAQDSDDIVSAVMSRLPLVLSVIAAVTFALLFVVTGSVVLPIKALVLNGLSLTAMFGAMVWIFQYGHLGGLGSTATGTMSINVPVLMFCVAFGLSMDYEIFLLSRIREYWLASGRNRRDNDESVALGLARTGRVVTAAALLMAIVFAGLSSARISFLQMFGVGLTIAVLMDATVVRMLLLPALMRILGRANWWAPGRRRSRDGGVEAGTTDQPSSMPALPGTPHNQPSEASREHGPTSQIL
jgi:putative drug exporter of the RND superfamily